ncbi:hypothetical protein QTP86_005033 [Hemibagrus guttatus]|nr:hypothetical protein QTP86_005033 [Hemibagrus guttatus]
MLFIDFSSAFNTINPQHLFEKLSLLGINTSLCNWIPDFLTGRSWSVQIGNSTSSATTLNTGAPQGYVLSPLLFTLLTHDCAAMHSFNHIIKFANYTTMVGLISKNDESAYREEVQWLTAWCTANNLSLNVEKMKEMVNFRRAQNDHSPLNINGSNMEMVKSTKFLGIYLAEIGVSLPSIIDIYSTRCICKANSIVDDPTHPTHPPAVWKEVNLNTTSFGEQFSYLKKKVSETKRQNGDTQTPCNYGDMVGCELEEKERFWSELDEVMESIPTGERVVIGADFNGHVGEGNRGDEEVMGKFGVKERNLEGQMVVDFAKRMDMGVVNTYFQKREEHRVTYKSGGRRTQVDYILCRRGNLKEISDCKVVVGESVARQHRMVVCRMTLMVCKKKRSEIEKKTKWWKLKKEECCEEFRQKLRQALGGQVVLPDDWETTAEVIRETGRKVLGVSSGRRKEDKETWWWNEEVQDSIQRKRLAKKKWDMDRTEENRQEYKELQRRVKREVSKAKQKAYNELYTRLDTREGEKDLYRLARQRDRDGKDVQQVRVIKDREGRVLTSEESVQRRWKEYFEELMNEENEREKRVETVNSVEQKVDKI